jgi:hypothetical protein
LIQARLEQRVGPADSQRLVSVTAAGAMAVVVVLAAWRAARGANWLAPVRASAAILLFYLLIAGLWFQAWYAIWPLALAALLPEGALARLIVLLSYSAVWKTIVFDFLLYRGGPLPPKAWRETWLGPATLGLAWLYAAYAGLRSLAARWRTLAPPHRIPWRQP